MMTSSGCAGVCEVLPTLGSSTWPGLMKGAVTMKMTSSTSITSIIGTTLIWATCLRVRAMRYAVFVAWRCRMLENSSMKLSMRLARRSMSWV